LLAAGTGTTFPAISRDDLAERPVPLPPLAEQKRIVLRVDQLMALIDDLEAKQNRKRQVGARFTKASLEALTTAESPEEFDAAWKRLVENWETVLDRPEKVGELRLAAIDIASRGRLVRQCADDAPVEAILKKRRHERRASWEHRQQEKAERARK